ncbi:MAG: PAS-domain containing protein, partial [Pseudomonadota bacterium]
RVTGRPHPDGAIAFLIEDVTAEVSLTRNFRAELELGQSLLDTLEDGIAVFTSAGVLAFCNAAYRTLWKQDPDTSFADITIHDAISVWNEQSDRGTDWDEVRDFVLRVTERVPWVSNIKFGASRSLMLCLTPIATGATVVRFKEPTADLDASIPMVEESDA